MPTPVLSPQYHTTDNVPIPPFVGEDTLEHEIELPAQMDWVLPLAYWKVPAVARALTVAVTAVLVEDTQPVVEFLACA
jgi:hypothetical protein